MAGSGRNIFTVQDASGFWGSEQYMRNELAQLESKGWLERLKQGIYLIIPLEAGVDREWSEDPLKIGTFLAPEGAAAYWTAMRHWGWTTQLPRVQLFITPSRRFKREAIVLGVRYRFVTVKRERIFGIRDEWQEGLNVRITDPERTTVDILDRTDLSGGIGEVSAALQAAWHTLDVTVLLDYIRRFGSGTVPKRLGYLIEQLRLPAEAALIDELRSLMGSGITQLERGGPTTGVMMRRWNLQINAGGVAPRSVEHAGIEDHAKCHGSEVHAGILRVTGEVPQRFASTDVATSPVRQEIVETNPPMRSDLVKRNLARIEEPYEVGAGHVEDICRLGTG
jgi:predicted transcriptional regulator of viral defense system